MVSQVPSSRLASYWPACAAGSALKAWPSFLRLVIKFPASLYFFPKPKKSAFVGMIFFTPAALWRWRKDGIAAVGRLLRHALCL